MSAIAVGRSPRVLAATGTPASVTGTTSETQLAAVTIPANLPGSNGVIRVTTLWSYTNNANTKTPRIRYSGSSGTACTNLSGTTTGGIIDVRHIFWNNATAAQKVAAGSGAFGTAASVSAPSANSTVDTTLYFSGQLGVSSDTLTLEGYVVEFIPAT